MFVLVDHLALDATTMNGLAWLDASGKRKRNARPRKPLDIWEAFGNMT
jgi:hypothetical protein